MRLTELSEQIDQNRYRCGVCQWRCELTVGEVGRCQVRSATPEGIEVLNDGMISAATFSAIEEYRLWHFFPGTQVLAIGGWGYAFPADQQRGQYGELPADEAKRRQLAPERAANVALERLARGVVWSFSDPSVSHEYVTDLLKSSRATSRYTALVTSGYATLAALEQFGPYLNGLSLELRACDDATYRRLAGITEWRGILELAIQAQQQWGCHIELTTRLHPQVNDAPEQIQAMGTWMRDALGVHTPWHLLPGDAGAAASASVGRARRLAHELGLLYVYGPESGQHTHCANCQAMLIERTGQQGRVVGIDDGQCTACGADAHLRLSIFRR